MAAPTPVSALVHSSTLVTAGVYLLVRFRVLLGCSRILFIIRLATMLMSGIGACLEQDAKKIVALSTLSQLGVIIFSLSIGLSGIAFFHLLTHALFKSLLFICMGLYIHGASNQQDLRGIGQQMHSIPVVSCCLVTSSLALSGFPFLSGFYSKDLIIELFQFKLIGVFIYGLVILTVLLTVVYSVRLIAYLYIIDLGFTILVGARLETIVSVGPMLFLLGSSIIGGAFFYGVITPVVLVGLPSYFRVLVLGLVLLTLLGSLFY
jgi:NADH-ubiquinone oxidoreductase chain 5